MRMHLYTIRIHRTTQVSNVCQQGCPGFPHGFRPRSREISTKLGQTGPGNSDRLPFCIFLLLKSA